MIRISGIESVVGRYIVASDGLDQRSTYLECWGAGSRYEARAVFASDHLGESLLYAASIDNDVHIIDRHTGRPVSKKRIAELEKEEAIA